jgi:hypothetical protein
VKSVNQLALYPLPYVLHPPSMKRLIYFSGSDDQSATLINLEPKEEQ